MLRYLSIYMKKFAEASIYLWCIMSDVMSNQKLKTKTVY